MIGAILEALSFIESRVAVIQAHPVIGFALFPSLSAALTLASSINASSSSGASSAQVFAGLQAAVEAVRAVGELVSAAQTAAAAAAASVAGPVKAAASAPASLEDFDWASAGLVRSVQHSCQLCILANLVCICLFLLQLSSLKAIFNVAISNAFSSGV